MGLLQEDRELPQTLSHSKRVTFWSILIVGSLLTCEVGVRLYRTAAGVDVRNYGYPPGLYVEHPTREYSLQPDFRGFFSDTGYREIAIEINSDGYRDDPFPPRPRGPSVRRIVLLGDSVTFGSGVRAGDRFGDRLEEYLVQTHGELEVLNLAVNSYTFFHYLEQVRDDVRHFDPDLVLIGFCLNDIAPKETSGPRQAVMPDRAGAKNYSGYRKPSWLDVAEKWSSLVWLGRELEQIPRLASRTRAWDAWFERTSLAWEDAELRKQLSSDMNALRSELEASDTDLLVLVLPVRQDIADPARFGLPRQRLTQMLRAQDVAFVDLHEAFARAPDVTDHFLRGDAVHLTPSGHRLVAETLGEYFDSKRVAQR